MQQGPRTLSQAGAGRRTLGARPDFWTGALLLLPGALVVYLGLNAGGYFPDTSALVAIALLAVLAVRVCVAKDPFEGFSAPLVVAAGGFALFALWTLLSGTWSNSPARALIEFDRVLLYLVAM